MASDGEVSCINDPNFAVICSFLNVFSKLCAISPPNVYELQEYVENTQEVLEPLKELHLKLLRRAFRSVRPDRWEKSLIKFCHQQLFHQEAWELERFGYKKASTHIKLKVLKVLLEYQFTCNSRFKTLANQIESTNLRQNPIGRDKQGCLYWLHVDHEANLRLYKEDQDEETWNLIASDRDGLVKIINMLKSGEDIHDDTLDTVNEDSNSIEPPTCEQKVDGQSNSERISKLESDRDQSNQPIETLEQNHESIDNFVKNSLNNKCESQFMVNDDESIEKQLRQEGNEIIEYKDSSDESDEDSCLLPNKRKKSEAINEDKKSNSIVSVSEEIEEPVLYVSGEGTGNDCESNVIYFSEEIVEPIFYIHGYGEGFACDTGNIGETGVENDACGNDNKSNKIDQKHSSGSKLHNTIVSNDSNGGTELTQLEREEMSGAQDSSCSPINLSVGDSDANRERSCDNEQNRISDSAPLPVTKRFLQKIPKISLKNVSEHQSTSQKPVLWSINTLCSDTDDKVDDNECILESKSGESSKQKESNEKEEKCKTEVSIREGIFNNIGEKRNCDKPTPSNFLFGHPGCLKLSLSKAVSDPSDRSEPIGNCQKVPVEHEEVLAHEKEVDTDTLNLKNNLESGQTPVKVPSENKVSDKEDVLEDGDREITSYRGSNKIKDNSNSSSNGVLKKEKTQSETDRETKLYGKHKVEDANKTIVQHVKEAFPDILPSKKLKLDGAPEEVRHPLLDKNRDQNIDNEFVDSSKEPNGNIISENVSGNDTEVTDGTDFQLEDPLNIENCTTATEEDRDCERTSKIKDKRAYIKVKKAKAGKNKKKNNHRNINREIMKDTKEELPNRPSRHASKVKLQDNLEEENLKSKKMGKKEKFKKGTEFQLTSCDSKTDVAMFEETKLNNTTTSRQANSKKKLTLKEKVTRKKQLSDEVDHIDTDEKKNEKKDKIGGDNVRKRMREMSGLLSGNDTVERGGKKLKMKPRRVLLNSRKNVEEKIKQLQVSSDEDADVAQDLHSRERGFRKNVAKKMKQESGKKFLPKKGIKAKRLKKTLHDEGGECAKNVKDVASVDNPVRQSRRIAQLKIREEAERRQMEEVALREMKEKHKKKSTTDNGDEDWRDSSADRASVESIVKKAKVKVKVEKKQKGSWKKWGSSSGGGGSDSESEEPDYEPEEPEDCGILKSDHEFSPESDLETEGVPQEPQRRARTLKKDDEKEDVETEGACTACGGRDHPEWILLCDACDAGHHASCLKPMLWLIPDGNWYCPPCQHARLIETLESELMKYDKYAQTIDEEKNKKITELAADDQQEDLDEDSESKKDTDKDVTSSDSKSSSDDSEDEEEKVYRLRERRQLPVSYRFKEYDQLMSSAIKEEYQEKVSAAGNMGRGKDISTIIEADKEEKQKAKLQSQMGLGNESKEYTEEQKLQERARKAASRKKPRKLNSLEVISEDDDDNSDEDFKETGWSMTSSEVSTEVDEASDTSRSSDSLPIRRSQRSTYTERRRVVESPEAEKKKKKKKRIFDDTTSSESSGTRDWANRKKKKALHKARIDKPRKIRRKKSSKVLDENGKKTNPRVTYGGLSGSEESHDWSPAHRTRQRKIDYTEMPNTESEDEMHKPSGKHMPDSSDEYKIEDSDQSSDSGRGRNKGKGLKIESSEEEKPAEAAATQESKEEKDEATEENETVGTPLEKLSEVIMAKTEVLEGIQSDDPSPKAEIGKLEARPLRGKGSRGGRQSRGARGGAGRGRSVAAGVRAADPDRTDETLINLIGVKIKDLTQDTGNNTDKFDSPEKVERERRRKEKEAKLFEKEQRKIDRLKKKEEKELLKEQKAKEKEAKKLARIAFLESKKQRKSKEFIGMEGGPIPIMGVAPGLAVGHPPRGAGRPSLSVKRGLTVRPFTERMPGRDFGRPRIEDTRTSQFLPLGPRACFPSGQGPMAPTQDQRTRPPGATGPRGEPIMPADPTGCGAPPGARLHPLAEAEGRAGAPLEFRSGFTAGRDVPPAGPRLQVRPELRRMRPDLSHLQRPAFAPDHRLLELGTMPSISVIDEAKLCGREPIKKSQGEGTLSVAGSPQPFKPATDAPSVITRMPHMMSSQYRASSIYGNSASMFGQGCGPPPHMAMYHRSRHPADGAPPPGSRAPYPGPYYPPLQMYPQRFPSAIHRPGRPLPNAEVASAEEPPKVKVEIKSEPEFSTASPPPEETAATRPAPAPASTETPRLKVKHTESKERPPARARLTAAARYPHGPYAPQYVPFGPYAPPVSSSETFPSSHAPQLSRTNVESVSASSSVTVAHSTASVPHGTPLQLASSVSVPVPSGLVRNPVKSDISRLKETLVPIARSPQPPADDRQMRPVDAEQDVHGPSVVSPSTVAGPTEEESGVFGGLVSYFSSQHEDDIDG